jgi:hypothetical protein
MRKLRYINKSTGAKTKDAFSNDGKIIAVLIVVLAVFGGGPLVSLLLEVNGGVLVGAMGLIFSLGLLAYWSKIYRERGLATRPRISFREIYVLYFGMSIEVGLIVDSATGRPDLTVSALTLMLPPMLIFIVAAMDDTPAARAYDRRFARSPRTLKEGTRAAQIQPLNPTENIVDR